VPAVSLNESVGVVLVSESNPTVAGAGRARVLNGD